MHGTDTTLCTDHKEIQLIDADASKLTCARQARAIEKIANYRPDLQIFYIPGKINPADALSRIEIPSLSNIASVSVIDEISRAYSQDSLFSSQAIIERHKLHKQHNLCFFGSAALVAVPNSDDLRNLMLRMFHDHRASGHFGSAKTLSAVAERYWWTNLKWCSEGH